MDQAQKREIINIDGKTICGAKEHGNKSPIHIVSVWACENNIVLGHVKTNEKSNEIKAIPELLDLLFIENSIVMIYAIGCQKGIYKKIVDKKADSVLGVKENQASLFEQIKEEFIFGKNRKPRRL